MHHCTKANMETKSSQLQIFNVKTHTLIVGRQFWQGTSSLWGHIASQLLRSAEVTWQPSNWLTGLPLFKPAISLHLSLLHLPANTSFRYSPIHYICPVEYNFLCLLVLLGCFIVVQLLASPSREGQEREREFWTVLLTSCLSWFLGKGKHVWNFPHVIALFQQRLFTALFTSRTTASAVPFL